MSDTAGRTAAADIDFKRDDADETPSIPDTPAGQLPKGATLANYVTYPDSFKLFVHARTWTGFRRDRKCQRKQIGDDCDAKRKRVSMKFQKLEGSGWRHFETLVDDGPLVLARIVKLGEPLDDTYAQCRSETDETAFPIECYLIIPSKPANSSGPRPRQQLAILDLSGSSPKLRIRPLESPEFTPCAIDHGKGDRRADFRGCPEKVHVADDDAEIKPGWMPCAEGCCSSGGGKGGGKGGDRDTTKNDTTRRHASRNQSPNPSWPAPRTLSSQSSRAHAPA